MLCTDKLSVATVKESGIFWSLVGVKIDESSKGNEEPNNPSVPTVYSTYLHTAYKERGIIGGSHDNYSLTNDHDTLLPGGSACLVCSREPSGWQSLTPGDQGPWKLDGTLYVSRS